MPLEESWVSTGPHSTASRVSSTRLVGIPQLTEGPSLVRSCGAPPRSDGSSLSCGEVLVDVCSRQHGLGFCGVPDHLATVLVLSLS